MRALASSAVLAVASTVAISAHAGTPTIALEWDAPAGCPTRELIEERIARVVGEGMGARQTVHAHARVVGGENGSFRADVELMAAGQRTSRQVEGDSCVAVADAVVLIVALAVEPQAASLPAPAPAPAPLVAEEPLTPPRSTPAPLVFVGIAARLDVTSLPAPAFGGELVLGLRRGRFEVAVDGSLVAPAQATIATNPAQGADIRLAELGARGCYAIADGTLQVGPCAGLHARWLSAQGFGTARPREASALFGVSSFGLLGRANLSTSVALRASVDAMVPLSRPVFEIDGGQSVYRVPAIALRIALGAEVHF